MRLVMLVGVILAIALGLVIYSWQMDQMGGAAGTSTPAGIVDSVAVRTDLLTIANAQRQQFALEGAYLSLAELRARGVAIPERRGAYVFTADVTPQTFLIKATHEPPPGTQAQPTMTIGPDMQVR
jgi:hypothetical protein